MSELPPGPAYLFEPYCRGCRTAGFSHCSDPINCGGTPPIKGYEWRGRTIGTGAGWVRPHGKFTPSVKKITDETDSLTFG